MAGIYLHIPFCKQACHYCNFHFSTSLRLRTEVIEAILKEMNLRYSYLDGAKIETIYLGGGTPSLLNQQELNLIFDRLNELFEISSDAEITLEANPDDLDEEKLLVLKDSPVNRLSIGIQSFFEEDLVYMNRAHGAKEASECIENALKAGFDNLTVDLIYGTPTTSDEQWQENIHRVFDFDITHISCYCLTVEPNTALDHFVKQGKSKPVDEEQAARQFEILMEAMAREGYEHYEISNFAKPGCYSKHNSNYWLGASYLGLGPSAHSFDGSSRQWNVANNSRYIKILEEAKGGKEGLYEREELTPAQVYNEYVMTSLRTKWGCDIEKIKAIHSDFVNHFLDHINVFIEDKSVECREHVYFLNNKGRLLADRIAMEVFI